MQIEGGRVSATRMRALEWKPRPKDGEPNLRRQKVARRAGRRVSHAEKIDSLQELDIKHLGFRMISSDSGYVKYPSQGQTCPFKYFTEWTTINFDLKTFNLCLS